MKIEFRHLLLAALCAPLVLHAQGTAVQLTPAADRISDQAIQADHATYRQVQDRIAAINAAGRPLRDYHLSKAQCWLDVSFHEYTRNDRSAFPQEALNESAKLATAIENKVSPLPNDTPLVNNATRLRPDLWDRAAALKGHAGYQCAQQQVACAEVELVHAGNEYAQQQWRHARPYIQIAEDRLDDATASAAACLPPPVVAAPVVVPAPAAPAPAAVTLRARVLFNFDGDARGDIRPESLTALRTLAEDIKARKIDVRALSLSGHADRLNSTGNAQYNSELSRRRMLVVRDLLAEMGVTAARVGTEFKGDSEPVEECRAKQQTAEELKACLLPNRRVEVMVEGLEQRR